VWAQVTHGEPILAPVLPEIRNDDTRQSVGGHPRPASARAFAREGGHAVGCHGWRRGVLLDAVTDYAALARAAGVDVTIDVVAGVRHAFQSTLTGHQ
jgi:hypothetical protein